MKRLYILAVLLLTSITQLTAASEDASLQSKIDALLEHYQGLPQAYKIEYLMDNPYLQLAYVSVEDRRIVFRKDQCVMEDLEGDYLTIYYGRSHAFIEFSGQACADGQPYSTAIGLNDASVEDPHSFINLAIFYPAEVPYIGSFLAMPALLSYFAWLYVMPYLSVSGNGLLTDEDEAVSVYNFDGPDGKYYEIEIQFTDSEYGDGLYQWESLYKTEIAEDGSIQTKMSTDFASNMFIKKMKLTPEQAQDVYDFIQDSFVKEGNGELFYTAQHHCVGFAQEVYEVAGGEGNLLDSVLNTKNVDTMLAKESPFENAVLMQRLVQEHGTPKAVYLIILNELKKLFSTAEVTEVLY